MITSNPFEAIDSRLKSIEENLAALAAKQEPKAEKKFYSPADVADKFNVAAITIYRGVEKGSIPSKRIGKRIMIPGSFVEK